MDLTSHKRFFDIGAIEEESNHGPSDELFKKNFNNNQYKSHT